MHLPSAISHSVARAMRVTIAGLLALSASPLRAQTSPPALDVMPLARGAGFTLRLDLAAPDAFDPATFSPMYDPVPLAALEWRPVGDTRWRSAQPLVRVESDRYHSAKPDPRAASMLFGLEENTEYEYRITFKRDGFPGEPITGTFRTLHSQPEVGPEKATVVVSESTSSQELRAAVAAAYKKGADEVVLESSKGPGKPTVVRAAIASIYHGGDFQWSGTPDRWKRLTVAEGHDLVFDGSRPDFDVVQQENWRPFEDAARGITAAMGVYVSRRSVELPWTIRYVRPGEDVGIALLNINPGQGWDGGHKATGIDRSPTGAEPTMVTRAAKNGAAWCWVVDSDGAKTGKLYVRLYNGVNPNTVYIKLPVLQSALDLGSCHHVVVDNLRIQYFGGWSGGIGLINVADIVIRNNRIIGTGMFVGSRTQTSSPKNRVIIKGNVFEERGLGPDRDPALPVPNWSWVKASTQERIGIPLMGVSVSILDNKISGIFNGVSNYVGTMRDTDQRVINTYGLTTEVDNNDFYGIGDDSIEPEQWCVNQAYTRNRFVSCYKGVSMAPVIGGPVFVLRNLWLGRGEFASLNGKQSFLKMGNDDPGDTGYKLVANNTIVNINADPNSLPLVGFANSGATYNHYYYNNYVASDGYCVDMGFGFMGYPQLFDFNRYRAKRFMQAIPSYDRGFAIGRIAITQGELMPQSDHRTARTFDAWQRGKSDNSPPNWPGYDGNVARTPRIARTPGSARFAAETAVWLHDPNSSFSEGGHELVAPDKGDFRPVANNLLGGAGTPLANISFDCGPVWSVYEESGRPTVGALPSTSSAPPANLPPVVSLPNGTIGQINQPFRLTAACSDPDGVVQSVTASVTDPRFVVLSTRVEPGRDGNWTVSFIPTAPGAHTVKVTALDNKGASTEASVVVSVTSDKPLEGELAVVITPATDDPIPGQPITYTFTVTNPTDRTVFQATLRQAFPPQISASAVSATLDGAPVQASYSAGFLNVSLGDMMPGQVRTVRVTASVN